MDLAAFSQPTFDAQEWAEGVLAPEKREGTLIDKEKLLGRMGEIVSFRKWLR